MREALAALWASGPAPPELLMLRLCREWSCAPSVVRAQRADDVYDALTLLSAEQRVERMRTDWPTKAR